MVNEQLDKFSYGPLQIARIYTNGEAKPIGFIDNEKKFLYGEEINDNISNDKFEWRNKNFEICDALQKIEDSQASMRTTVDLFQKQLHAYTITHAIEDGNVLRFHVDYFKPEGKNQPKPGEAIAKKAVIEAILAKHDAATGGRRFNAILATASINDAIEYHALFKTMQADKQAADPDFKPLNIACVRSPRPRATRM